MFKLNEVKFEIPFQGETITFKLEGIKSLSRLLTELQQRVPNYDETKKIIFKNKEIDFRDKRSINEFFGKKKVIQLSIQEHKRSMNNSRSQTLLPNIEESKSHSIKRKLECSKSKLLENFICECNSKDIFCFCRDCGYFLCENCLEYEDHYEHDIIKVNKSSFQKNLIEYCDILRKDIKTTNALSKKYGFKIPNFDYEELVISLTTKLKEITTNHLRMLKLSKINYSQEQIEEVKSNSQNLEDNLNNIIDEIESRSENLDTTEASDLFTKINNMDKTIEEYHELILNFKINREITGKVEKDIMKIEDFLESLNTEKIFSDKEFKKEEIYSPIVIERYRKLLEKEFENKQELEVNNTRRKFFTRRKDTKKSVAFSHSSVVKEDNNQMNGTKYSNFSKYSGFNNNDPGNRLDQPPNIKLSNSNSVLVLKDPNGSPLKQRINKVINNLSNLQLNDNQSINNGNHKQKVNLDLKSLKKVNVFDLIKLVKNTKIQQNESSLDKF